MTDEIEFDSDTLEVDDDGHVIGSAFIGRIDGEHDVSCGVFSYDFENGDEEIVTNHVPSVVVTKSNGGIVAEPHVGEERYGETAIEQARKSAKYVAENIEEYI